MLNIFTQQNLIKISTIKTSLQLLIFFTKKSINPEKNWIELELKPKVGRWKWKHLPHLFSFNMAKSIIFPHAWCKTSPPLLEMSSMINYERLLKFFLNVKEEDSVLLLLKFILDGSPTYGANNFLYLINMTTINDF